MSSSSHEAGNLCLLEVELLFSFQVFFVSLSRGWVWEGKEERGKGVPVSSHPSIR